MKGQAQAGDLIFRLIIGLSTECIAMAMGAGVAKVAHYLSADTTVASLGATLAHLEENRSEAKDEKGIRTSPVPLFICL